MFEVHFFEKMDGSCPVEEFIRSTDRKMMIKIYHMIEVLEEKGTTMREPYTKYLEDGIFELCCKQGTDIVRVLYFFYYGKKIIMTNGFVKKTDKTPKKEIKRAKRYRAEYLKECEKNEKI